MSVAKDEKTDLGPPRFGKYLLLEKLGRGGMAEVWRARLDGPAGFSRQLVLKKILPELASDQAFLDMFLAEARLSARLHHPNIVQVIELGEEEGEFYLAMEYVAGADLVGLLRAHVPVGPVPPGMAAFVVGEVARALAHAHGLCDDEGKLLGLIHRDVSPSNIMVSFDGAVKLLDFGIAKALNDTNPVQVTRTGELKGKFGYMSPEQVNGEPIDLRADVFAVGVVLWETLASKRLFKGDNQLRTITMVREANVPPITGINPEVPQALERIVNRALARKADDRYPSCSALAQDLDEIAHELHWGPERMGKLMRQLFPTQSRPQVPGGSSLGSLNKDPPSASQRSPSKTAPPAAPPKRSPALLVGGGLLALAAVGGALAFGLRGKSSPATATPPGAVAPSAPAAPSVPSVIDVEVITTPPGAQVTVEGDKEPRGRTPLTVHLAHRDGAYAVELSLDGYTTATAAVQGDKSTRLTVSLTAAPAAPAPAAAPPPVAARPVAARPTSHRKPTAAAPAESDSPSTIGDVVDPFKK